MHKAKNNSPKMIKKKSNQEIFFFSQPRYVFRGKMKVQNNHHQTLIIDVEHNNDKFYR